MRDLVNGGPAGLWAGGAARSPCCNIAAPETGQLEELNPELFDFDSHQSRRRRALEENTPALLITRASYHSSKSS